MSLRSMQITHLVIVGGDGTVQSVLSHSLNIFSAESPPIIIVIPGGTTNMTASDLGIKGFNNSLNKLKYLINNNDRWKKIERPMVKVETNGQKTVYGFFFGAGVIANGVVYFNQHVKKSGITGEIASAFAVIPYLFKLLISPSDRGLIQPIDLMYVDGKQIEKTYLTLYYTTTLERLLFGLKPHWGIEDSPLRLLFIKSPARKLWRSVLMIIFKRGELLKECDGYFSHNSKEVRLIFKGHYIIDGEIFHASSQNSIQLTASKPLSFLVP